MAQGTTPWANGMATSQAKKARIKAIHLGMLTPFNAVEVSSIFGFMGTSFHRKRLGPPDR
jgi:hypothetical protein